MRKLIFLMLIFLVYTLQVSAYQTIASGEWSNPSIWNTGQVPGPDDAIIINHQVYSDNVSELTISGSLQIKLTGQLNIESIVVNGTLTNSGLLTTRYLSINSTGYVYNYGSVILIKCDNSGYILNQENLQVNYYLINQGKIEQKADMEVKGYLINNNLFESEENSQLVIEDSLLNNGTFNLAGRVLYPIVNRRQIFNNAGTINGYNGGIASKNTIQVINNGAVSSSNGEAFICLPEGNYTNNGDGTFVEKCCFMMQADAGPDRKICAGSSTILGGKSTILNGTGPFLTEWINQNNNSEVAYELNPMVSPLATTTYKLYIEDANGCRAEDSVVITPQTTTFIRTIERFKAICQGETVNLGELVQVACASNNYTYSWFPTNFLDDPEKENAKASPTESTIYHLDVLDVNGNVVAEASVAIFVDEKVTPANAGEDMFTCGTNRLQLAANNPIVGIGRWNILEGTATIINNFNPDAFIFELKADVMLEWKIRGFVCESSDQVAITFLDTISQANAGPDQELYGVTSTQLAANMPASGVGKWSLLSGNANIEKPAEANSEVTELVIGSEAMLEWRINHSNFSTVDPATNCPASADTMLIKVYAQERMSEIFVPQMFTPNQDGQNDMLYANAYGVTELLFRIFDRTGKLIFETEEIGAGWDGRYHGKELPTDTYVYYVRGISTANEEIIEKGSVQLVR